MLIQGAGSSTVFPPTKNGNQVVCADYTSGVDYVRVQANNWLIGYWSGLNSGLKSKVGRSTSAVGILGEIKLLCEKRPSLSLIDAADVVFFQMQGAGQ